MFGHQMYSNKSSFDNVSLPLKERIKLAKEHMLREGQQYDVLWPHQRFAVSLGELIDAAERGA